MTKDWANKNLRSHPLCSSGGQDSYRKLSSSQCSMLCFSGSQGHCLRTFAHSTPTWESLIPFLSEFYPFLNAFILGINEFLKIYKWLPFTKLGKSSVTILSNFFSGHSHAPFLVGLYLLVCETCWYCATSPWGSVHVFPQVCPMFDWIISTRLFFKFTDLICSFAQCCWVHLMKFLFRCCVF